MNLQKFFSIGMIMVCLGLAAGCSQPADEIGKEPLAYGTINSSGAIYAAGSDNYTVTRQDTGEYHITLSDSFNGANLVVNATVAQAGGGSAIWYLVSSTLVICTYNTAGSATNFSFSFTVWE